MRVIGSDGKLIGVLTKNDAVKKAKEQGLTLVEIAPNATPPVAKIVDFGKFRYAEEKKARQQAKGIKGGEVKEVRFSPFIAENDFRFRIERIKEFFAEKDKVRVVVVFTGPQMRVKSMGYKVIEKILSVLGDTAATDMEPKFLGKHLITVISPISKKSVKIQSDDKTEGKKIDSKKA